MSTKGKKFIFIKISSEFKKLKSFIDLINVTTGDAITDFLCVEIVLNDLNISLNDWANLYKDLPNRLSKVIVSNSIINFRYMIERFSKQKILIENY